MPHEPVQGVGQGSRQSRPQHLERRSTIQLEDDVAVAGGDARGRAERLASLRDPDAAAQVPREVQTRERLARDVSTAELKRAGDRRVA